MSSLGWLASDFMEYSPSSCADATCSLVKEAGAMADRVNSRRLGTPSVKGFSETEILIARPTDADTCDLKPLWLGQVCYRTTAQVGESVWNVERRETITSSPSVERDRFNFAGIIAVFRAQGEG